jgi:UrcA family protein
MLKLASALALTGLMATTAAAQTRVVVEGNAPAAQVSYADLNLETAAGLKALNGRVREAADRLCLDHDVRDMARSMLGHACRQIALESAQSQIRRAVGEAAVARRPASAPIVLAIGR